MGSYLQNYGVEDEKRGRTTKRIVVAVVATLLTLLFGYLFFHNFPERQMARHFLADVNSHDYKAAYVKWGCTSQTPCPNYDFKRFMDDWGTKNNAEWKVASSDSCNTFLTVNVQATGSELQSLAVQRSDHSLGFAPAPECQEKKWRFKAFFQHLTGRSPDKDSAPPPPSAQ